MGFCLSSHPTIFPVVRDWQPMFALQYLHHVEESWVSIRFVLTPNPTLFVMLRQIVIVSPVDDLISNLTTDQYPQ